MDEIIQEYISNCVQEDIQEYISLHKDITPDLLDHCAIMTNELYEDYYTVYNC